jgi:hypothetical protein
MIINFNLQNENQGKGIKFPLFILSRHSIYFQVGGDNPKVEGQEFF